mgnify:FL=1
MLQNVMSLDNATLRRYICLWRCSLNTYKEIVKKIGTEWNTLWLLQHKRTLLWRDCEHVARPFLDNESDRQCVLRLSKTPANNQWHWRLYAKGTSKGNMCIGSVLLRWPQQHIKFQKRVWRSWEMRGKVPGAFIIAQSLKKD